MCVDLLETIPTAVCTLQVYNCRFRTCASSYMCKHSYITASKVNATIDGFIPLNFSEIWRFAFLPPRKFCEDGKTTREAGCSLKLSGVFMRCTMPNFSISMHLERNYWSEDIPFHQPTTDHTSLELTFVHTLDDECMRHVNERSVFFFCWWLAEEAKRY